MPEFDKNMFERHFSNETRRGRMLELLATSLSTIDRFEDPSWTDIRGHAVTYQRRTLRLHLGHKIVMALRPDSVFIALDPNAEASVRPTLSHYEFPTAQRTASDDKLAYASPPSINPLYRTELFDSDEWKSVLPYHLLYVQSILESGHKNVDATRNDVSLESYVRSVTGSFNFPVPPTPADVGALEGEPRLVHHFVRERNPMLTREKLRHVRQLTNEVRCEACGFLATDIYGDIDSDLCDVHHLLPLSELSGQRETTLSDLAVLCPTCHRAIHRTRPMMSVEDFRGKYHSN